MFGKLKRFALALVCVAYSHVSLAATHNLTCTPGNHDIQTLMQQFTLQASDIVNVSGFCTGQLLITQSNVSFVAQSSLTPFDPTLGLVEVAGATGVTFQGITVDGNSTGVLTPNAGLYVHDGASIIFSNGVVQDFSNSPGVLITRGSTLLMNGTITVQENAEDGIRVSEGSYAQIGTTPGLQCSSIVSASGGNGVTATTGSNVLIYDACLSLNGLSEVYASQKSSIVIVGIGIIDSNDLGPTPRPQATIVALGGSSIFLESGFATDKFIKAPSNNSAIFASGDSTVTLRNAVVETSAAAAPLINASDSSSIVLIGGNNISNPAGVAIQLDHSSGLQQRDGSELVYYPPGTTRGPPFPMGFTSFNFPARDTISGSAFIQEQSSLDVGIGNLNLPNDNGPSLVWAVPASNCILVQQNSSIRVSGGVEIDGAPPSVCTLSGTISTSIVIQQESNGFFNLALGGTDAITGGGGVSCTFTSIPNAHVSGKGNITPASAQPAMIGNLAQALTATSPGCLGP